MSECEKLQVYLRLMGKETERFRRIKEAMGLKNDTEVLRSLITWYWKTHQDELEPSLIYVNTDEQGVKIFDRSIPKVVSVFFSQTDVNGVKCGHCERNDCRHVTFAMEQPEVQKIIREGTPRDAYS